MRLRYLFALFIGFLVTELHWRAAAQVDTSGKQLDSVVIVELFTSEGCSSCPPADALLQQVHLKRTSAGQLIVGLSEHVTYWNNLGWKDPYSEESFTDRQEVYASRLSPDGAYTPQIVLNGRDQFVGSDGSALQQALRNDAHRKHSDLKIESFVPQADSADLKFSLAGSESKRLDIVAVLTDDMDHSNVLRGENAGRNLQHVSVVRSLSRVITLDRDSEQTVHLSLPEDFLQKKVGGHHLVLFAQEPNQGPIVGAAILQL